VSKRAVDTVFEALFTLTDLRVMLRDTAPQHRLDDDEKKAAEEMLRSLEGNIRTLREELIG
jgi:hypothetical protein